MKENIIELKRINSYIDDNIKLILIAHPFIYNESEIYNEIEEFIISYGDILASKKIKIVWINYYHLEHLSDSINEFLGKFSNKIDLILLNELKVSDTKFFDDNSCILAEDEKQFSKNLLLEFFPSFPLQICHNFVFEFCAPQFSLPLFWYPKIGFEPLFEKSNDMYIYLHSDKDKL